MSETTIHATIGKREDPTTGHVTLFIKDQPWGPIVTGATYEEAKAKFLKVLPAVMVANSYCEIERSPVDMDAVKSRIATSREEIVRLTKELEECPC